MVEFDPDNDHGLKEAWLKLALNFSAQTHKDGRLTTSIYTFDLPHLENQTWVRTHVFPTFLENETKQAKYLLLQATKNDSIKLVAGAQFMWLTPQPEVVNTFYYHFLGSTFTQGRLVELINSLNDSFPNI